MNIIDAYNEMLSGKFEFDSLADNGHVYSFHGVCNNSFKLDQFVWEAVEDPDDGYRSMLDCVELRNPEGLIFYDVPIAMVRVVVEETNWFKGYRLIEELENDKTFTWLEFGTQDFDDYYPCFIFSYLPDGNPEHTRC